jgi:RNA polymerase sigma-70 factor, ECF subfamily
MEESDRAAVARAQAGDSDSFRLLVERHSRGVFRLAYRITGHHEDAEDVVQETFLRAYRQLEHFENRASFGTWLYRIAANYALDLVRMHRRYQDEDAMASAPAVEPAPDRIAYGAEVRDKVASALGLLSGQERTAFVLRHYEGFSIEEIGEALGTGASATKHSIFRAVQKLRRALEPVVSSVL